MGEVIMARVEAICISPERGTPKQAVDEAEFVEDWGIADDAHAGRWHRQVSLLAAESIERMKELLPDLAQGAFAENVIVSGIDPSAIEVGDLLKIGSDVLLEITQLGKECHEACEIQKTVGDCIMPREGLFARVLEGGMARSGDSVTALEKSRRNQT
jgi:MOSC domain-containing protein YiiM